MEDGASKLIYLSASLIFLGLVITMALHFFDLGDLWQALTTSANGLNLGY